MARTDPWVKMNLHELKGLEALAIGVAVTIRQKHQSEFGAKWFRRHGRLTLHCRFIRFCQFSDKATTAEGL